MTDQLSWGERLKHGQTEGTETSGAEVRDLNRKKSSPVILSARSLNWLFSQRLAPGFINATNFCILNYFFISSSSNTLLLLNVLYSFKHLRTNINPFIYFHFIFWDNQIIRLSNQMPTDQSSCSGSSFMNNSRLCRLQSSLGC